MLIREIFNVHKKYDRRLRLRDTYMMGVACISLCCQQTVKELALCTDTWNNYSRAIDKVAYS